MIYDSDTVISLIDFKKLRWYPQQRNTSTSTLQPTMEEWGCDTGVQYVVCSSRWNPSFLWTLWTLKLSSDLGTTAITLHQPIGFCCTLCSLNSPRNYNHQTLRSMVDRCHLPLQFAYVKAIPWSVQQIWFSLDLNSVGSMYGIFTYICLIFNTQYIYIGK